MAVGVDVKGWKTGDRVCSNFATEHLHGDIDRAIQRSSLGGQSHGVLTEYRTFPSYVRFRCIPFPRSSIHRLSFTVTCIDPAASFVRGGFDPTVRVPLHSSDLFPYRYGPHRCAGLTAYNSLLGPVPVKAGDYILVLGTGGVSMSAPFLSAPTSTHCYYPVSLFNLLLHPVLSSSPRPLPMTNSKSHQSSARSI